MVDRSIVEVAEGAPGPIRSCQLAGCFPEAGVRVPENYVADV